jgi:hypothetical protein
MNNDSSANSSRVGSKAEEGPVQAAYEGVLGRIKSFKQSRKDRENELENMRHLREALMNTGFDQARDEIAERMYRKTHPGEHWGNDAESKDSDYDQRVPNPFAKYLRPQDDNQRPDISDRDYGLVKNSSLSNYQKPKKNEATDSPFMQLKNFRKEMAANPDLSKKLMELSQNPQGESALRGFPDELEYSQQKPKKIINSNVISDISAFGNDPEALKQFAELQLVKIKILPLIANILENRMKRRRLQHGFSMIKGPYHLLPRKGLVLSRLEKLINKSLKESFFTKVRGVQEVDSMLTEKLKDFYRLNLKRIFFSTLKDYKVFQRAWIAQVRETIQKSVMFTLLKRNLYEERTERKTRAYYTSKILGAWKRIMAQETLIAEEIVTRARQEKALRLLEGIMSALRAHSTAGRQDRRRDLDAIMHYQKTRLFSIFEFWKTLSVKRKRPIDFSRYSGLNSIPIRVTHRQNIELLDDNIGKVVKSREISTQYKLLHPNTKT